MKNLSEIILQRAQPYTAPNQRIYSTLTLPDRDFISATLALSKKGVEIAALETGIIPQRYLRNMGTLGPSGQLKLLKARVLIIGAGGLGGTTAHLLARMGLGTLILVDGDCFSEDNLNRQAFSSEQNIGQKKVEVIRSEILKINAAVEVETFAEVAREKELDRLIKGADVAMDALDNMSTRLLLEKVCKKERVPMVHGAVAGFGGQMTTIFPEDAGFRAFYGDSLTTPESGIEVELGNLPGIVSAIASLRVQEAVKIITGLGRPLRNRLLFLDSLNGAAEMISLK
jgi:molybdopterin/thiamine biosynthesis adenylyltransferase